MSSNTDRVYFEIMDELTLVVDDISARMRLPREVGDDIIYYHDPANLNSREGRKVEDNMRRIFDYVDGRLRSEGYNLSRGQVPKRVIGDAVYSYVKRGIDRVMEEQNRSRDRDGSWGRGERYSSREGSSGFLSRNDRDRNGTWSSPIAVRDNDDDGRPRGNPFTREAEERDTRRGFVEEYNRDERPVDRERPVERERERYAEPEPVRRASPPPLETVQPEQTELRELTFRMPEKDEVPALLTTQAPTMGLRVDDVRVGTTDYALVHAVRGAIVPVVGDERHVLRMLQPVVSRMERYLLNIEYRKAEILEIPAALFGQVKGGITALAHSEAGLKYWTRVDEFLSLTLRTAEKAQVESVIVEEFNKRLVTFLRKEHDLEWYVTLNSLKNIDDLVQDSDIPAYLKRDMYFVNWCAQSLYTVISELFNSELVSGSQPATKVAMLAADGDRYLQGRTMAEAAVDTNGEIWPRWVEEYRKHRVVIVRKCEVIVSNLGADENHALDKFTIDNRNQGNHEFWAAYTEESIVSSEMAELIRRGQRHVYLTQERGNGIEFVRFDTVWCLMDETSRIVMKRHGYKPMATSPMPKGQLLVA